MSPLQAPGETELMLPGTQNQTPGKGRDSTRAGPVSNDLSLCLCTGFHLQFGRSRSLLRTAGFGADAPQAPAPTSAPGISGAS